MDLIAINKNQISRIILKLERIKFCTFAALIPETNSGQINNQGRVP